MGADYVFNSNDKNLHKLIFQLTQGGADFCVESAGSIKAIRTSFSFIRGEWGKLIFASHPNEGETIRLRST